MLTLLAYTAPQDDGPSIVLPRYHGTHSPDPDKVGNANTLPAEKRSSDDNERILVEFTRQYVGLAHGIVKAELERAANDNQCIRVYVDDWNGVINIPKTFLGLEVTFTQFVPPGGVWQL